MKRISVSKRSVSVLPSGFVPVPSPWTSATPTTPLKSVIDDGSVPAPKEVKWNAIGGAGGGTVKVLGVGLGASFRLLWAKAVAGLSKLAPSAAPATPAVLPINPRRESTW